MPRRLTERSSQYRGALENDVIPFWSRHSLDREQGGYFSCLNRDGAVYDTDKFVWLQARQAWMFAALYNRLAPREEWLSVAKHGIDFLTKHGRDESGNWFFSLTRAGVPLVQPYNIFSDCFAAMAFSEYALAADDDSAREIASQTFANILARKGNPKGQYNKAVAGTRPSIALSLPMILANLTMELKWMLPAQQIEATLDMCIEDVFTLFLDEETGMLHETVAPDGSRLDSFDGRLLLPGHAIEAMWFMMDVGEKRNDSDLVGRAVTIALRTLEKGWDRKHGGIFYFLDATGTPPDRLDWDQKLWWVHLESLVALLKGFRLTGDEACWGWFETLHDYTWAHFPDPDYGEWYGYLNRRGEVLLPMKGGKWKGCFHVPRALHLCHQELAMLAAEEDTNDRSKDDGNTRMVDHTCLQSSGGADEC